MGIKAIFSAAAVSVLCAVPAAALTVHSQSAVMTKSGQNFDFSFTNLAASDGTGGMLVISSGAATKGSKRDAGFDLDGKGAGKKGEFFKLKVEGESLGRYSCGGRGKSISIPGYKMNGDADCKFSLGIALSGSDLDEALADGTFDLSVAFGWGVDHFREGDMLKVALKYTEAVIPDAPAPVPLPAAGLLLVGGLGAMGAVSRRRKSKS